MRAHKALFHIFSLGIVRDVVPPVMYNVNITLIHFLCEYYAEPTDGVRLVRGPRIGPRVRMGPRVRVRDSQMALFSKLFSSSFDVRMSKMLAV